MGGPRQRGAKHDLPVDFGRNVTDHRALQATDIGYSRTSEPPMTEVVSNIQAGDVVVFHAQQRTLCYHGEEICIRPRYAEVLTYLARRPGSIVEARDIECGVWGALRGTKRLAVTLVFLRRSLTHTPVSIQTVGRSGYRLVGPLQMIDGEPKSSKVAPHYNIAPRAASALRRLLKGAKDYPPLAELAERVRQDVFHE
jgi:DNA-binding winged helix-turn-helix (wHTH) protein